MPIEKHRTGDSETGMSNQVLDDAISALINLGYSRNEAEMAAKDSFKNHGIHGEKPSVEAILKESLKVLGKWK